MAELKFEIVKELGSIGESIKGWRKELNLISWNDRNPKADLRDWDSGHEKMGKGLTLTKEELIALKNILNDLDLEKLDI
ncbi:MAG: YdbC family protein [Fusobacteriaceae bacterium]